MDISHFRKLGDSLYSGADIDVIEPSDATSNCQWTSFKNTPKKVALCFIIASLPLGDKAVKRGVILSGLVVCII